MELYIYHSKMQGRTKSPDI